MYTYACTYAYAHTYTVYCDFWQTAHSSLILIFQMSRTVSGSAKEYIAWADKLTRRKIKPAKCNLARMVKSSMVILNGCYLLEISNILVTLDVF